MEYKVETSLRDFPAWSGGKDTLDTLIERDDWEAVEEHIENIFMEEDVTDEMINDYLWFERDAIAEYLGYSSWEEYDTGEEAEEEDGESFEDVSGTPIQIGDIVIWHDEAGEDEDGSMIEFKVVEDNGDGYFNIAYEGEENPERWAYCGELEVLE